MAFALRDIRTTFRHGGFCIFLSILALTACSSASQKAEEQRKMAASYAQSARVTLEAWSAGAIPSHYARRTLESLKKRLAEAADQIKKANGSNGARQPDPAPIERIAAALGQAGAAMAKGDRVAVEIASGDFHDAAASFPRPAEPVSASP
jgi:hypothetical protein